MELKKHVKEFFRRITNWFKDRKKRSLRCYWPEINRYCGCCDLTTGIYIRSVISVILSLITLGINGAYFDYLKSIETIIMNLNLSNHDDYIATLRETPEDDHKALCLLYRLLVVYYTMWIIIKATHLATVLFTAFAIYRKNTRMLKFLLFVSILNWVLDFFILLAGCVIIFRMDMNILMVICNLSEGYHILALNSEYKKLRGKPILSAEYIESQQQNRHICVTEYITQQPVQLNEYTQVHCRTCTCFENPWNICNEESRPVVISSQPIVTTVSNNINESNYYTTNINVSNVSLRENTFNDGVTEVNTETEIDEAQAVRRNSTELEFEIKGKEDVADIPVIYDQQQLNVGSSSVIEDRGEPT